MQGFLNMYKLVNIIQHINQIKNKNNMLISMDAEKPLTKFNILSW
jgi:hypothetical protein